MSTFRPIHLKRIAAFAAIASISHVAVAQNADTTPPTSQTAPVTPAQPVAPVTPTAPPPTPPTTPPPPVAPTEPVAPVVSGTTAAQLLNKRLSLGDGREFWHPTRAQLGFALAPGVDPDSPAKSAQLVADRNKALAYFKAIAPYVQRSPVNARPAIAGKSPVSELSSRSSNKPLPIKILPSRDGAALQVDQATDTVIQDLLTDPETMHIALPTKLWPAKITGPSLAGIDARIGHFVTHFTASDVGRTQTVRLAINLIDGHIVQPGEVFSVNDTVGERTTARGFGIGHVFVDGQMKKDVGGGMCQVASTLFNAALLANLKIVERFQHVRTVPYVKAGSDATVWYGAKDLKVQNDSGKPIFISYKTTHSYAICDLYGKADPTTKVEIVALEHENAPRDWSGSITRYVTKDGVRTKDYEALSHYKWTPALDFVR